MRHLDALALLAVALPAIPQETGAPTLWTAAPVILRVSDAVKPGDTLGVYGEGLSGDRL